MVRVSGVSEPPLKIATSMMESTSSIRRQDSVPSLGSQVISTVVVTRMMKGMVTVRCTGQTAVAIKVNGSTESNMALALCPFPMAV